MRWRHPERGLIFPDTFLPLAERAGLMRQLTDNVLDMGMTHRRRAWSWK